MSISEATIPTKLQEEKDLVNAASDGAQVMLPFNDDGDSIREGGKKVMVSMRDIVYYYLWKFNQTNSS